MNEYNIKEYIEWSKLIDIIKKRTGMSYETGHTHKDHNGLSLNGKLPYSISEYEFNYMKDFILKYNLKNGYELATGTGISGISIGWALGENGGKLITVDSYLEEEEQIQPTNNINLSEINNALDRNKSLFEKLNLKNVFVYKSFSPDCYDILDDNFDEIDFVFLDCPKNIEDFIRDTSILKDRLSDEYVIFVHDTHCFPQDFITKSREIFGVDGEFIHDFTTNNGYIKQRFPLGIITNIKYR